VTIAEVGANVELKKNITVPWLLKVTASVIGGGFAVFGAIISPAMFIYMTRYGADGVDGVRKDVTRLEDQVKGLSSTVGGLQITVAAVNQELKTSRSETNRGIEDIKRMLDPPVPRPAPRPRQSATTTTRTQ
jgi:hypothetical protein